MNQKYKITGAHAKVPAAPHQLTDRITPIEKSIVLCHLGVPDIEADDWLLAIVVIGVGIAGSALGVTLARNGISVLVLEKSERHLDRVRGEFIVPWGIAEAEALGILGNLTAAGASYTTRSVPYGDGVPPEVAKSRCTDLGAMVPDVASYI